MKRVTIVAILLLPLLSSGDVVVDLDALAEVNGTVGDYNGSNFGVREFTATAIPEPGSVALVVLGAACW